MEDDANASVGEINLEVSHPVWVSCSLHPILSKSVWS